MDADFSLHKLSRQVEQTLTCEYALRACVIQSRLGELRSANRLGVFWILLEHSSTTTFVGNWRRAVKIVAYRRDLNPCYRRDSQAFDRN